MSKPLLTSFKDNVLEITLNRPEHLNAFTIEMHELLQAAFTDAKNNFDIKAIMITGAGRGFCAGQDLSERDPASEEIVDLSVTLNTNYNPLIRMMRDLEKPILCAVNGVAAGAGANFALACDIVIASQAASFIQVFSKLGIIPDAGGTYWLTTMLGEPRAKALAMTAAPLSAKTAEEWGLIWKCVCHDMLMDEVRGLARSLAKGATLGLGKTKFAIQQASINTLDAQLDLEAKLQGELGHSDDFKEGISAFLEKREAVFKGK